MLKVLDCEDEYVASNLLILNRLVIDLPYRGRQFGLEALRGLMQRFRVGAGLIVMKPFPLQFEGEATREELETRGLAGFKGGIRAATSKLRAYYAQLGFKSIPRTPFMAVSTAFGLRADTSD